MPSACLICQCELIIIPGLHETREDLWSVSWSRLLSCERSMRFELGVSCLAWLGDPSEWIWSLGKHPDRIRGI